MVDERRLRRLLQRVGEDLTYLRSRAAMDRAAIRADEDRLAALKYYLVTSIEGCLDAAQHICASEGLGPPSDNADAMRLLGKHGWIPTELAASMSSAVRFRNLLVHEYGQIDDERVVGYLDRVSDLDSFVASIATRVGRPS